MDIESQRDLALLTVMEEDSRVTQRRLADRVGIALGLANLYVRRLVHKGYIKCVTMPPNRLVYLITPRGLAHKARLTYEFMQHSGALFRDARRHLRRALEASVHDNGARVALFGTGEAAELAFLSLKELGAEPVAVFDKRDGAMFLGVPVRSIKDHEQVDYDMIVIASFDVPGQIVAKLARYGVPREKMVTLR